MKAKDKTTESKGRVARSKPARENATRKKAEATLRKADQHAIQEYEQLLERLAHLAQIAGTARDLTSIFRGLREFAEASVPCNGLFVSLYDPEKQERICVYSGGDGEEDDVSSLPHMPMTGSPQSQAIATGQVIVTDDLQSALAGKPVVTLGADKDPRLPQSSLAVPLIVLGRVIGAFEVQSVEPAVYKPEHVTAMHMAADLAAIAAENVQLLERDQKARLAAQTSEARFRALVENGYDVIIILNPDGTGKYISPAVTRVLGYRAQELEGRNIAEFIHPDELTSAARAIARQIQMPGVADSPTEFRVRHKDGSWRVLEVVGTNLLDDPSVKGIVINGRDITGHKQAEKALRESERRYQTLAEVSPAGIFRTDAEGNTLYVNRRWCEIARMSYADALGNGWLQAVHPEDRAKLAGGWQEAVKEGKYSQTEYRFLHPDGSIAWVIGQATPEIDKDDHLVSYIGTITDITERKRAEKVREAIYEISQAAVSTATLDELYHSIHRILGELIPVENFYIALYDPVSDLLNFPYFVDHYDEPSPPRKLGRGLTDYVLRTGQTLLAPQEVFNRLVRQGEVELVGVDSIDWLGVPLKAGGRIIGAMVVQSYTENIRFKQEDASLLEFVSTQVALAIGRKQTEEAIRASEERFRSLVENSSDEISILTAEGALLYESPSVNPTLGYQPGTFLGQNLFQLVHPNDLERVQTRFTQLVGNPDLHPREQFRLLHRNGTWRWIEAVGTNMLNEPSVRGIVLNYHDITDRKRAEERIAASEAELRALFAAMHDVVLIIDDEGIYRKIAPTDPSLLYRPPEELLGKSLRDVFPPAQAEQFLATTRTVVQTNQTEHIEYELQIGERLLWFSTHITKMDEHNSVWVARDITEYKRAALRQEIIYQVLRAVSGHLDLNRVAQTAVETLVRLTNYPHVCLALPDEKGTNWVVRGAAGSLASELGTTHPIYSGVIGRAFKSGQMQWVRDILEDPDYVRDVSVMDAPALRSEIVALVRHGDQLFGALNVESERVDAFDDNDAAMIRSLADLIALALANARLYEDAKLELAERKQAEEALRASEEKYHALIDNIDELVYIVDVRDNQYQGKVEFVSAQVKSMAGCTPDEFMNDPNLWFASIHPDDMDSVITLSQQLSASNNKVTRIYRLMHKTSGEYHWMEDRVTAIPDERGKIIRQFGVVRDITERKRAEDRLKESEARLLYAQRVAHIGNWDWNFQTNELYWSGENYRIFGLPPEMHPSVENFLDTVDPTDVEFVRQSVEEALSGKKPYNIDMRILRPDGQKRVVHAIADVTMDDAGKPVRMFGTVQDITERRQAEDELLRRAEELTALYENGLAISGLLDSSQIAQKFIQILDQRLNWHHAVVHLKQPDKDEMQIIGYSAPGLKTEDIPSEIKRLGQLISRVGQGMTGWVVQHGQTARNGNLVSDPRYIETYPNILSGLYAPLKVGEEAIGAIGIESEQADAFTERDERLLVTLAAQTAIAIQNARLFEDARRRLRRTQVLREIDQAIASSTNIQWILEIILSHVTTELGVDAAVVLTYNPNEQLLEYAHGQGLKTSALQHTRLRAGDGYAGRAVLTRRLVHIRDLRTRTTDFLRSPTFSQEGFNSYFGVPLIAKGEIKGVLEILHRAQLDPDKEWLEFMETLAGQIAIAIDNATLYEDLQRSNVELIVAYDATIEGWSKALDLRDRETEGHTQRVTELTLQLARAMDVSKAEFVHIRHGALLHDIGKMGIPDSILFKPDKLTDEEWEIMRKHPIYAHDMLSPIAHLGTTLDIPYCHHEKWDGTGYPRGLKGEQIPLAARLFAVVDVWDALISDRPYRPAWPKEKAIAYIREQSEKYFDPKVVGLFLRVMNEAG